MAKSLIIGNKCQLDSRPKAKFKKVPCSYCGKEIERALPRIKRYKNQFCSTDCQHSFIRKKVKIICNHCGKEALVWPSQKEKAKHHFCSQQCHFIFKAKSNAEKSVGKKYGQLTVLSFAYNKKYTYVNCKCDCGNMCCKILQSIKEGKTIKCSNCSDEFRFMKYVNIISDSEWLWTGAKLKTGYGYFRYKKRNQLAHRVSYQLFKGEIPKGICVLHKDDNPSNVAPENLKLGSLKDNSEDMVKKLRNKTGENHYKAKLTEKKVARIRELNKNGVKIAEICSIYNISDGAIRAILNNQTWKYVKEKHHEKLYRV